MDGEPVETEIERLLANAGYEGADAIAFRHIYKAYRTALSEAHTIASVGEFAEALGRAFGAVVAHFSLHVGHGNTDAADQVYATVAQNMINNAAAIFNANRDHQVQQ
jgi:hypothetical protein